MTAYLQSYSEYKESGDDWLGQIPSHWSITSVGAISLRRSERNRPDLPLLSVLREKGVVLRDSLDKGENRNFVPDDLGSYRVAHAGDLIINKMKAWQGSVGIAPIDGIVSPAYFVYKLNVITKEYAHRLLRSKYYADFFARSSDGVRIGQWDLNIDKMKRIPVIIPPPDEQDAIVAYLDQLDRRVRRFIRNRRRLIEVLNEQKQAIITQAVTRGLDPNVKLKPSGIEWLGDIPEHWSVLKLRDILRQVTERNQPYLPLLSVIRERGVMIRDVDDIEANRNFIPDDLSNYKVVRKGQFAVNKMKAWQGSYGVSDHDGIVSPAYFIFKLRDDIHPQFFHFAIRSRAYIPFFGQASDGVRIGQWDLSTVRLKEIPFLVPPRSEQEHIASSLPHESATLTEAFARARREIELIREYRTRLIADVVTGKVDVRHLAPEPGEIEAEPEIGDGIVEEEMLGEGEEDLVEEAAHADD